MNEAMLTMRNTKKKERINQIKKLRNQYDFQAFDIEKTMPLPTIPTALPTYKAK